MNKATLKAEEQRQAKIITEAIDKVILETGNQFEMPMLNAIAGALVSVEAKVLNTVKDRRSRLALKKAMEAARPKAMRAKQAYEHMRAETVTINDKPH